MVEFHGGFDADEHESPERTTIPEGYYTAEVIESEKKEIANGKGHQLSVKFKITGGEYDGRWVWSNFSMWHQKDDVRAISKSDFARLCKACEKVRISDSRELHGCPLTLKIKHRKWQGKIYEDVKEYLLFGQEPAAVTTPAEDSEKAPWEK